MIEIVLCTVIWGLSFLAQKLGGDCLGPFTINCLRNIIAGAFLLGCVAVRRRSIRPTRSELIGGTCSGICLFAAMMAQQIGIADTTPGVSAFLTANYVLLVPVFGLFLSRRPGLGVWVGIVLAMLGTYFICIEQGGLAAFHLGRGEAWTLLCAVAFAVQILVVDHFIRDADLVRFSMVQMTVAGLVALPFMFLPSEVKFLSGGALLEGFLAVVFLGIFSSGIAYTLQCMGQKKVPAALASIVMSLESVFAALFAWLLMSVRMTPRQLFGSSLILAAVLVAQLVDGRRNRRGKKIGVLAGLAILVAAGLFVPRRAANAPSPVSVPLANRVVEVKGFSEESKQTTSARGTLPYVLATRGRVNQTLRQTVEAAGVRVIGPLSESSFLVETTPKTICAFAADPHFAGAVEFLPMDKLDGRLAGLLSEGVREVTAAIVALAPADKTALQTFVTANHGEILEGCLNGDDSFRARLPAGLVGRLLRRGDVRWVEQFTRPHLLNDFAVEPLAMNVREVWNTHGLTGANQIITTTDSGVDTGDLATMHRDLANRICALRPSTSACTIADAIGHGTHTAGSIVGDGTMSDGRIRGVAYGARLWVWGVVDKRGDLQLPSCCEEMFCPDQTQFPAYIHSASWGDKTDGSYDDRCVQIDTYVWSHPEFLPIFAVGNQGAAHVNTPASAKNVLAVGATQNLRQWSVRKSYTTYTSGDPTVIASFSSCGPCLDGRTKPDICAPGVGVLSTRSSRADANVGYFGVGENENYAYDCGTSMSTPLTAGAVALIREYLVDRCGYTNVAPSAALMKAIVTGGAKGVSVPDNTFGWGRVDLGETLFPSNRSVKLVDRLPFAEGRIFTYEVTTTNIAPLEVQLAWIDYPATAGLNSKTPHIVNDLDLVVEPADEEGACWFGNGGTKADGVNTLESVRIATAAPKRYRITVSCRNITYDHENGGAAALYVRGAFDAENGFVDRQSQVRLTVAVDAGAAVPEAMDPAAGVYVLPKDESVVLSASEWACEVTDCGTRFARHRCLGCRLNGETDISVSDRIAAFTLSNDLAVVWQYRSDADEYRYRQFNVPMGLPDQLGEDGELVADVWYTNRHKVVFAIPSALSPDRIATRRLGQIVASATDERRVVDYLLDGNGSMVREVELVMNNGVDLRCGYFSENDQTVDRLPYWWYMRYLWGGAEYLPLGYDGSADGDPDGDGFMNRAEYEDETNPVDDLSFRFKIDAFSPTNMTFTGSIKGCLVVERADTPSGEWQGVLTNTPPRVSTTNAVDLGVGTASNGFYRVRYEPPSEGDAPFVADTQEIAQ